MWINLTTADLNEYLAAPQVRALQTKALADGQTDPTPNIISEIAEQVRNVIAAAGYPLESSAGTFPEVLKPSVAALVIELAQTRIPGLSLTTEQRNQVAYARTMLANITAQKVAIEPPVVPDYSLNGQGTGSLMRVVTKGERIDREGLRRLS
jgi:hypothetical protein